MSRKIPITAIILACSVLGVTARLMAQRTQEPLSIDIVENLKGVQSQLTALNRSTDAQNKQVMARLEEVLSNQRKIMDELAIVKVRATRK